MSNFESPTRRTQALVLPTVGRMEQAGEVARLARGRAQRGDLPSLGTGFRGNNT